MSGFNNYSNKAARGDHAAPSYGHVLRGRGRGGFTNVGSRGGAAFARPRALRFGTLHIVPSAELLAEGTTQDGLPQRMMLVNRSGGASTNFYAVRAMNSLMARIQINEVGTQGLANTILALSASEVVVVVVPADDALRQQVAAARAAEIAAESDDDARPAGQEEHILDMFSPKEEASDFSDW